MGLGPSKTEYTSWNQTIKILFYIHKHEKHKKSNSFEFSDTILFNRRHAQLPSNSTDFIAKCEAKCGSLNNTIQTNSGGAKKE